MTNQKINDVDTITTFSSTDRLLVNTDVVHNVLEQIEKDDFVADIVSSDSGNLLDIGTDNKLAVIDATITLQGNTFNGNSQLIQTNSSGQYPALDGSLITNVSVTIDKTIMQIGTCSTASATAEKAVTSSGFVLATGATIQVTFTNANSADVPTLNVNSTGAKAIYNESGTAVSSTNPAYFPAGSTVEFTYNGTNWVYKNKIVENYVNSTSGYDIYTNGKIKQWGFAQGTPYSVTITLYKPYKNTNYTIFTTIEHGSGTPTASCWNNKTTTNFKIFDNNYLYSNWETEGY